MIIHSTSRYEFPELPVEIPDSMLNEEWAENNHHQSLKILNERGGMGVNELLDNIHKRKCLGKKETKEDVQELLKIINDFSNDTFRLAKETIFSKIKWQGRKLDEHPGGLNFGHTDHR